VPENLQQRLDEQRERSAAARPPEVTATIAGAIQTLRDAGIAKRALRVGASAPDFALPNAHGSLVRLGDLLARGPVVLAFYRGVW
jgi:hypothetical protein